MFQGDSGHRLTDKTVFLCRFLPLRNNTEGCLMCDDSGEFLKTHGGTIEIAESFEEGSSEGFQGKADMSGREDIPYMIFYSAVSKAAWIGGCGGKKKLLSP